MDINEWKLLLEIFNDTLKKKKFKILTDGLFYLEFILNLFISD